MLPRRVFSTTSSTPAKSPVKKMIPLNDDKQEKADRLYSRQAQHEMHMSQIKAAATPMRKRRSLIANSPHTPAQDDGDGLLLIAGTAVTPMKRVPIMANFEEWMKMATDNKINATNSWNFALIDYFHDMSLLKEGDGVNFQRASCTLDGCVKIYTNRVDSVATETGKLLSGLADSNSDKRKNDNEDEEGEDGDGEEENGERRKPRKKTQRTAEATLATSFSQLQLKKMELEFAIDPLFKKASADFDEGGAKGLLLNHLAIDATGRIVFDSSDDAHEVDQEDQNTEEMETGECAHGGIQTQYIYQHSATQEADMDGLAYKFFPDLGFLDGLDICPSLKTFELGEADGSLDLPFLKAHNDWNHQGTQGGIGTGMVDGDEDLGGAFEYDDNIGEFDLPADVRFGEGGEAWAKEAALDRPMGLHILHTVEGEEGAEGIDSEDVLDCNDRYGISMRLGDSNEQQNILDYFDKALQKNWAGPEHWKIRRVKDASKSANAGPTKRKERESFEIDFVSPMSQALADALYTPVTSNSAISLPRTQWRSKTRNLLPDDKHFSSRQLLRLFLKPKAILSRRQGGRKLHTIAQPPYGEIDEQYWAQQEGAIAHIEGDDDAVGNYDANFFLDDGFGGIPDVDEDDEFADARDHFSPQAENGIPPGEDGLISDGPFGAQLVTQSRRLRPEYVQYARVATKVDVRRLKEEIWRGLAIEEDTENVSTHGKTTKSVADDTYKFTEVINSLQTVYPKQAMADISTSYCFICVLHLANEKGLMISNHDNYQELTIRKDHSAEIVGLA